MKIAIVGVGAMGSLFAYLLYQAGYNPWLLDKCQERVDAIKKDGLRVEGVTGSHHCALDKITTDPEEIDTVDLLIIFVKAYDTEGALRGAVSLVGDNTLVLTLQSTRIILSIPLINKPRLPVSGLNRRHLKGRV